MQKVVVASHHAANGIAADHGKHLYITDNIQDEAAAINMLLGNAALRKKIGKAARLHVQKNYSWSGQLKPLDAIMQMGETMMDAS